MEVLKFGLLLIFVVAFSSIFSVVKSDAIKCYKCMTNEQKACSVLHGSDEGAKRKLEWQCMDGDICGSVSLSIFEGRHLARYIESRECRPPRDEKENDEPCSTIETVAGRRKIIVKSCWCTNEKCNNKDNLKPPMPKNLSCFKCLKSSSTEYWGQSCEKVNGTEEEKKDITHDCGPGDFVCEGSSTTVKDGANVIYNEHRQCMNRTMDIKEGCTVKKFEGNHTVIKNCYCEKNDRCNNMDLKTVPIITTAKPQTK